MAIVYHNRTTGDLIAEFNGTDIFTKKILEEFDKPLFENMFFKNIDFLLDERNHELIPFNKDSWTSNPKQFCADHYDSHHLDRVILLINNIPNFFEFTNDYLQNIKAPKIGAIIKLIQNFSNF